MYGALAVWSVLLLIGIKRSSYRAFILFGIAVLLFLSVRNFIKGALASIAFFIGIYDVFDNLALNSLVFIIMHWQLARPGFGESRGMYRFLGKVAFVLLTIGTGPLLCDYEAVSLLILIWFSAPLGIVLAEMTGRYQQRNKPTQDAVVLA